MTGFTPPPRRELPPDVRDRLRRRLWRDLDAPGKARFDRAKPSIAAAIGVVVITAFAVIFAQTVPAATHEATPAMHPDPEADQPVDAEQADAELDRCYQAASSTGHTVPNRPQWSVVFMREAAGISVTAARADGKPLFCESTLTSVTVSDPYAQPAYAAGSATGTLLTTANGTIAGVVDPTWQRFEIRASTGSSFAINEPDASGGLFVMYSSISADPELKLNAQQLPADSSDRPADDDPVFPLREIPDVPQPLVFAVDRPVSPPADRVSPRGQALQQCMSRTRDLVPDMDSWQPGAAAVVNGDELIMAANTRGVATCQWQPYRMQDTTALDGDNLFHPYLALDREPQFVDAQQMIMPTGSNAGPVIAGTVRADATRMTVTLDGKVELDTDVRAGTFVSVVPASLTGDSGLLSGQRLNELTAVIYDARGNILYDGPLNVG